ncbi:MAG: sulfotransferase family protein [Pseudonocardiaceae bacterium]
MTLVPTSRLVEQPVFILSSIRSGSTLLRCILNSHPQIVAPHELHLVDVGASTTSRYAELAMEAAGLTNREIEHLLWDRILHRTLVASGKEIIVDKTPSYALHWRRLGESWPSARFIFLLRDPADILASAYEATPDRSRDDTAYVVGSLIDGVQDAQEHLAGHDVRYEDLANDPERTTKELCSFLGVEFESEMLQYTVPDVLIPGIGDFTQKIRTGQVLPPRRYDGTAEPSVARLRRRWGYA